MLEAFIYAYIDIIVYEIAWNKFFMFIYMKFKYFYGAIVALAALLEIIIEY